MGVIGRIAKTKTLFEGGEFMTYLALGFRKKTPIQRVQNAKAVSRHKILWKSCNDLGRWCLDYYPQEMNNHKNNLKQRKIITFDNNTSHFCFDRHTLWATLLTPQFFTVLDHSERLKK